MTAADPQDVESKRVGQAWWLAFAAVAAVGIYYRVREVGSLHLILDERLVLRGIRNQGLLEALTQHTMANNSPALTIYAQLLHRGDVLNELTLRLPMLASGILLLGIPLLFAARLGRPTTLLYLALTASSAPLVYFSFVARPYAPTLLAIGIAFFAWDRWCRTDSRVFGALFGVASSLAIFFHAFAAPVVAGLFAAGLHETTRGRLPWKSWWHSVAWAGGVAALLLGPGTLSFASEHGAKLGAGQLSADLPLAILERLAGGLSGTSLLLLIATVIGLVRAVRLEGRLGLAGCLAIAFPVIALIVLRPLGGAADWARYIFLCWPIALFFAATGLGWTVTRLARALDDRRGQAALAVWAALSLAFALLPSGEPQRPGAWLHDAAAPFLSWGAAAVAFAGVLERLGGRGRGIALAAALLFLGTLLLSPLRLFRQAPDSFRSHPRVLEALPPAEAPAFYARLAAEPDGGSALAECPDPGSMLHSAPYARYQRVHGKRVLLLSPIPEGFERGFRNRVDVGDLAALRRSDARYALVHRNLNAELPGRTSAPLARFTTHAQACRSALRNALGPPVHSDDLLEVFDLRAAAR